VSWMFCAGLFSIADLLGPDHKILSGQFVSPLYAARLAPDAAGMNNRLVRKFIR
jgi:hypothetical protein